MAAKIVWIGLLLAAVAAACYPIFLGKYYAVGDTRDVFIPLELFFQNEIRQGHLPAWMPQAAWGFPVIAAAQIGFFYPPLFLGRLLLPIWFYWPLMFIGHLAAMGVGMYVFARALALSRPASYLAAVCFTLGQFVWQHTTHLNIVMAIAWFPWQMWYAHRAATRKNLSARDLAGFILLLGIPFLAGQLQMPLLMAIVTVVWFIWLCCRGDIYDTQGFDKPNPYIIILRQIPIILFLALGTFALASAQLLPTLELVQQSSRGAGGDFDIVRANQYSFPLYHLPTLLFPRFYDNDFNYWGKRLEIEYGVFMGSIPLIVAMWALFRSSKFKVQSSKKFETWILNFGFFKWLLVVSFLLALGSLSPIRLLGLEPSLWVFSAPTRWLFCAAFGGALLAAVGWEQAVKKFPWRLAVGMAISAALVAIMTTLVLFSIDFPAGKLAQMQASAQASSASLVSWYTWLPLLTLGGWLLVWTRHRGKEITLVVVTVELIVVAATTTPAVAWRQVLTAPDTMVLLPANVKAGEARIFSVREGGDTGAYFSNPASRPDEAKREELHRLLIPLQHTQFGLHGVEWPAALDLQAATQALEKLRGREGYEVRSKEVAADLTIGAVLAAGEGGMSVQVLPTRPRLELTNGTAVARPRTDNSEQIEVESAGGGQLIIRDTWYPGWRALVDGRPVVIEKVNNLFRGIAVPPGRHVVEIRYQPTSLLVGMIISGVTLVLCLVGLYKKNTSL